MAKTTQKTFVTGQNDGPVEVRGDRGRHANPSGDQLRVREEADRPDHPSDFKLPDFTVSYEGDTYYWEHLGMLTVPAYREQWERKRQWYEQNGYSNRLITSEESPGGRIDASRIERIARSCIVEQS